MTDVVQRETTVYSKRRWGFADLQRLPDGYRYEIIDGVLYMAATPGWPHPQLVTNLLWVLIPWAKASGFRVFAPQTGIYYNEVNYVDPDVLVLNMDQLPRREGDHSRSALLAVEVVSASNLKAPRVDRERLFAQANVEEIWYLNHHTRSMEVCRRVRDAYEAASVFTGETLVRSATLPGLEFPLSALWDGIGQ